MLPLARVEAVIGRAFAVRADAQERAESVERVEAPVKAERELIQVGLQVLVADRAVVRPGQPSLQIRENKVDDGQVFFRHVRPTGLDNRQVLVAERGKAVVAAPCVRDDHRARLDCGFHKARQRLSAARRGDFQPKATGIPPAAPHGLVAFLGRSGADLYRRDHKRLVVGMGAFALAAHHAADVGFVNLDMIAAPKIPADAVATLADHARAQLVQDVEGGFVPAKAKLALELHRRHAGRHARHKVSRPKPDRQRGFRVLHHGSLHKAGLPAAFPALQDRRAGCDAERLALFLAVRANEAFGPLGTLKVARARRVILEKPLEVPERFREGQVFPLQNIGKRRHDLELHNRRAKCPTTAETLARVAVCVNRIGMK